KRYHFRLDVDVPSHVYTVWVRNDLGGYDAIGRSYAFRTEAAGVTRLNNVASKVVATDGTVDLCGFVMIADATTGQGCVIARAGDGFVTVPLPDAMVLDTVTFTATPSEPSIDAVIGLAGGAATAFSDLATAARFSPGGVIDARDGDGYRAQLPVTYTARAFNFR